MPSGLFEAVLKCLRLLPRYLRWRWAALIPLLLVGGLAELGGAAVIFWMIQAMSHTSQPGALSVHGGLGRYLPTDPAKAAVTYALILAIVFTIKNTVLVLATWAESHVLADSMYAAFRTIVTRYLGAPYPLHARRNSSHFIHTASQALDTAFRVVMFAAVGFLAEVLVVISIAAVLVSKAPMPALSVLLLMGLTLAVILQLSRRAVAGWGAESHDRSQMVLHDLQQIVGGIREITVFGIAAHFRSAVLADMRQYLQAHRKHTTVANLPRVFIETIFVWSAFAIVGVLVSTRGVGGDVVPMLALFAYAGFRIIPSANRFVYFIDQMRYGRRAVDRVHDMFTYFGSMEGKPLDPPDGSVRFERSIDLDHVSFTHPEAATPSVQDVSLSIRRGESIGVVGTTGCGKSTLVDLVAGLIEPTSGAITIDGLPQAEWLVRGRRRIGYVPQSIYLLDDTVRRNIALGVADAEVNEESLHLAVKIAQLETFVSQLPQGLNTEVGERGVRLSGGERQRVAIARAVYLDPDVILLDEATASLDLDTEQKLNDAIGLLQGKKTLIIVAHRLTTVRLCDRIIVMREGRIVGIGSYEELSRTNPDFRSLASHGYLAAVGA